MEASDSSESKAAIWSRRTSIVNAVQEVYDLTKKLFQLVENKDAIEERDHLIEKITSLLDEREQILHDVKPPFTDEERLKAAQIMKWNERVNSEFIKIKAEVQNDMAKLKQKKATTAKYTNPYQNVNIDGMFYDKRK